MTREEKMQAVVEAARKVVHTPIFRVPSEHILALADALAALDAPDTADETVTMAVWEDSMGEFTWVRPNSCRDRQFRDLERHGHDCLGTVTLLITRERGE